MRLLLVICALAIGATNAAVGDASASVQSGRKCVEDAPCWNWAKMGNRTRAVYVAKRWFEWVPSKGGSGEFVLRTKVTRRVVGPCRFRRLERDALLAWDDARMQHLWGDGWALRNGCK